MVAEGRQDRDMISAVQQTIAYVDYSDYAMQLRPYLELFGRDRVFALTTEELKADPEATFTKLFTWLGISADIPIETSVKHNVSPNILRQTRRGTVWVDTLLRHKRFHPLVTRIPNRVRQVIDQSIYREVVRTDVSPKAALDFLRPILQPRVQDLSRLLDREFPEWATLFANSSVQTSDSTASTSLYATNTENC
jgi:hypothetical protein